MPRFPMTVFEITASTHVSLLLRLRRGLSAYKVLASGKTWSTTMDQEIKLKSDKTALVVAICLTIIALAGIAQLTVA